MIEFLSNIDLTAVSAAAMIGTIGVIIYRLHTSENSKFFFDHLLTDDEDKASTSKIATLVALVVSTWAFIHLTLTNALTEWFFIGYIGAWVLNRSISKWTDVHKTESSTTSNDS
jgi:hypothetical protein